MLKDKRGQSELGWILAVVLVVVILVAVLYSLTGGFKDFNSIWKASKSDVVVSSCAGACNNPSNNVFCGKDTPKTTFEMVDAKGVKVSGTCYELSLKQKADSTVVADATNPGLVASCPAIKTCP